MRERRLLLDLPGHGDEVFSVDWSPDGERVCSGGKDTILKFWRGAGSRTQPEKSAKG